MSTKPARKRNEPVYETKHGVAVYAPTKHDADGTPCSHCGKEHTGRPAGYPSYRISYNSVAGDRSNATRVQESRLTKTLAKARADEVERQLARFGNLKDADKSLMTVAQMCDLYMQPSSRPSGEVWSETTETSNEGNIRLHIKPLLGKVRFRDLEHQHAKDLVAYLRRKGLADGTILNVCITFCGVVRLAEGERALPKADSVLKDVTGRSFLPRPSIKTQGGKATYVEAKYIPELPAIGAMRDEMERQRGWVLGFLTWFICQTGLRIGEGLAIRTTDISFEETVDDKGHATMTVTVDVQRQVGTRGKPHLTRPPKRRKTRKTIYADTDLAELHYAIQLAEAAHAAGANPDRLLFPSPKKGPVKRGKRLDENTVEDRRHYFEVAHVSRYWRECADKLGWEYGERPILDDDGEPLFKEDEHGNQAQRTRRDLFWTAHSLRHFFGSWALRSTSKGGLGLEVPDVSHLLGHENPEITMNTYWNLREGTYERAAKAAAAAAIAAAAPPRRHLAVVG